MQWGAPGIQTKSFEEERASSTHQLLGKAGFTGVHTLVRVTRDPVERWVSVQ